MATPAEKARLTTRIKSMEDVLRRWKTYARDEYLDASACCRSRRLDEARAERDAMDREGEPDAARQLR